MSNPSKDKGTRWETEVVNYLADNLPYQVERRALAGGLDKGDIAIWGGPGSDWALECKNTADWSKNLSKYVREAEAEAANAGVPFGAVIIKRRQHTVADAYVVVSLRQLTDMLQ